MDEPWLINAKKKLEKMPPEAKQIRQAALDDLFFFATLVNPGYLYGDVHKEVFKWLQEYNIFGMGESLTSNKLIMLPRAHLKALRLDQRVITPKGWVATGDLQAGDYVYGQDGQRKKVLEVHPISKMKLFQVTTRTGRKVVCNEEHLWNVICPSNTKDSVLTKPLKEIIQNYKSLRKDKKGNPVYEYRYFLPNISPVDLPEKHLPIDPYVLGAWLGDGTSSQGAMTSADPEIMKEISYFYQVTNHNKKYGYGVLGLREALKKNGLLNNKHVPAVYLQGSIGQRLSLLQGLMDTDGTVQSNGRVAAFSNKNKNLIDAVVELVRSLGGVATVGEVWSTDGITDKRHHSYYVTIKMQGLNPFRLPRKVVKFSNSRSLREAIVDIVQVEDGLGRCITVEDSLFITEDYTLTHNSHMVATWCAWIITRHPEVTMLYVSATAELAEIQLYAVQNILGSSAYQRYFPEYVNPQEGQREKWSMRKMSIDHEKRKIEGIRDATISTAGLTTNTTGWHADIILADDLVVPENAYTEDGRDSVSRKASQFTSIRNAGGFTLACGTRYHPADVYSTWKAQEYEVYGEDDEIVDRKPVWDVKEYVVEVDGIFTWPKRVRSDGKSFGFDNQILARIRAEYSDKVQFYAQYYNNPNDPGSNRINRDRFQYYDRKYLHQEGGVWFFKKKRLNTYAAIDFAFSLSKKADYTAIVVVGIDEEGYIYILDIDRFKSDKINEYFNRIAILHSKWDFKKLRAEVTVAQSIIVGDLKDRLRSEGLRLSIDEYRPTRKDGRKEERIAAALEHRYDNMSVWHYKGGFIDVLEEELILTRPPHDDVADALASVVEVAIKPKRSRERDSGFDNVIAINSRFGGIAFK